MKIRNELLLPIIKDSYFLDFDRIRANRDNELLISVLEKYFLIDTYAAQQLRDYHQDYFKYYFGGKKS